MLKVVHLIAPGEYGGAESVVRELAIAKSAASQHIVAALIDDSGPHAFLDGLEKRGCPLVRIPAGGRRYGRQVRQVATVLRSLGADILHTHVYHADIIGYLAGQRCGIPTVATAHGFTGGDRTIRLYEWLDMRVLRRFDRVICVSDAMRRHLLENGLRPERLRVVRNGLSWTPGANRAAAREQLGLPADARVIGWIGRLSHEKGADLLLDAMSQLDSSNVCAALIGNGPQRSEIEARLRASPGLGSRVRLLGSVANAAMFLAAFDALAITSRTEGLPITLLEALNARVPVVSFAVGGVPEVIDQEGAWLAPAGDVFALAAQVRTLLSHPELAVQKAARAHEIVCERFHVSRCIRDLDDVYQGLGS